MQQIVHTSKLDKNLLSSGDYCLFDSLQQKLRGRP